MSEVITGLRLPGLDVRAVTADSRTARPGTLFVAIPGGRADGRAYIADAVARVRRRCWPRPARRGPPACRPAR